MAAHQMGPSVPRLDHLNFPARVYSYVRLSIPKNPIEENAPSEQCGEEVMFGFVRNWSIGSVNPGREVHPVDTVKPILDIKESLIPIPTLSTSSQEPTPELFGAPLELGGWKCERTSWLNVVPVKIKMPEGSSYRNFEPPIKISEDELHQIDVYRRAIPALHTLGFDDPDTLAANEAERANTFIELHDGSGSSGSTADSPTLKECLAMLAMPSGQPFIDRIFAKELDKVLKREEEERRLIRNEKLDVWFKGLPDPPV